MPPVRLQRVIADAGVASRREAEALIESGRVQVNGRTIRTLPAFVDPSTDRIVVSGRPLPRRERRLYILLNKPARCLSTAADDTGRPTVLDLVKHPARPRLFPVGRLDFHAVGLMLLTNDGPLAQRLSHPSYEVERTYHAVVRGPVSPEALPDLERRIDRAFRRAARGESVLKGKPAARAPRPAKIALAIVSTEADRAVLAITLRGGGRRELQGVLADAGISIKKLERVSMGPLRLSGVARGRWRELDRDEVRALRAMVRGASGVPRAAPTPAASRRRRP